MTTHVIHPHMALVLDRLFDVPPGITLAEALKRHQGDRKQRDVAEELGISPQHLSDILHGRKLPSYGLLINIAAVYKLPPGYLLGLIGGLREDMTWLISHASPSDVEEVLHEAKGELLKRVKAQGSQRRTNEKLRAEVAQVLRDLGLEEQATTQPEREQ